MVCDVTVEALFGSTVHHHPAAESSFHNCPRIHRVRGRIVSVYGEMRPRTWLPERRFVSLQCCYINGGPGEDLMRCVVFVVISWRVVRYRVRKLEHWVLSRLNYRLCNVQERKAHNDGIYISSAIIRFIHSLSYLQDPRPLMNRFIIYMCSPSQNSQNVVNYSMQQASDQ